MTLFHHFKKLFEKSKFINVKKNFKTDRRKFHLVREVLGGDQTWHLRRRKVRSLLGVAGWSRPPRDEASCGSRWWPCCCHTTGRPTRETNNFWRKKNVWKVNFTIYQNFMYPSKSFKKLGHIHKCKKSNVELA